MEWLVALVVGTVGVILVLSGWQDTSNGLLAVITGNTSGAPAPANKINPKSLHPLNPLQLIPGTGTPAPTPHRGSNSIPPGQIIGSGWFRRSLNPTEYAA